MKTKKTARANLENERMTYFLLAFSVVLSTFFVVLEWQSTENLSSDWEGFSTLFIEEEFVGLNDEVIAPKEVEVAQPTPEVTYEDFNTVDEIIETEEIITSNPLPTISETIEEEEVSSQLTDSEIDEMIHLQAETMPQFKGGQIELIRFIYRNMEYPSVALKQKIQGRVWCSFVVNKDGTISNIQLEQGVYIFLDEEALRVLKMMPNWTPGTINGLPIRVKVYIPIVFKR